MGNLIINTESQVNIEKDLKDYMASKEEVYGWEIHSIIHDPGVTTINLYVTSQKWQGVIWKHFVVIYVPTNVVVAKSFNFLDGGRIIGGVPQFIDTSAPIHGPVLALMREFSESAGIITCLVRNLPMLPTLGQNQEETYMQHTFEMMAETRDVNWNPLKPMIKGAIQCHNAIEEVVKQETGVDILKYAVSGLSKRGLTTYFSAIFDKRVEAIAPIVMDYLNTTKGYERQLEVNDTPIDPAQIELFSNVGAFYSNPKPLGQYMVKTVDPYYYLDSLKLPIYSLLGTNDPFYSIDLAKFYVKDLEDISLVYQRNIDHNIGFQYVLAALYWYYSMITGTRLPTLSWTDVENSNELKITVTVNDDSYSEVRLVTARSSTENFLKEKFNSSKKSTSGKTFTITVPKNSTKYLAAYVEVAYQLNTNIQHPMFNNLEYTICSRAYIIPKKV